jgi:hypothetical protein
MVKQVPCHTPTFPFYSTRKKNKNKTIFFLLRNCEDRVNKSAKFESQANNTVHRNAGDCEIYDSE